MRVCSPDAADLWVHILFRCTYCDSSDITAKSVMDLTLQMRGCMSWPGVTVGSSAGLVVSACPGRRLQIARYLLCYLLAENKRI